LEAKNVKIDNRQTDRSVCYHRESGSKMNLKETIIFESIKLFSTKGYASCSITEILEAANVSKGGFYNHFRSKEELFQEVLAVSQRIWREKTLYGLDQIDSPIDTLKKFLENYRDRYLKDSITFPGGCIFVTFSVELDNHRSGLMQEVNKGFAGLKRMLRILLEQCKEKGELRQDVNTFIFLIYIKISSHLIMCMAHYHYIVISL
jgi:TetR/AcrR family transcriptional repressor of nem operon